MTAFWLEENWGPEARAAALAARRANHPDWNWGGEIKDVAPLPTPPAGRAGLGPGFIERQPGHRPEGAPHPVGARVTWSNVPGDSKYPKSVGTIIGIRRSASGKGHEHQVHVDEETRNGGKAERWVQGPLEHIKASGKSKPVTDAELAVNGWRRGKGGVYSRAGARGTERATRREIQTLLDAGVSVNAEKLDLLRADRLTVRGERVVKPR